MFLTAVIAVMIAGVLGLIAKVVYAILQSESYDGDVRRISWSEFIVVFILMAAIIAPVVTSIGSSLSVAELLRYDQFVNGVETATHDDVTICRAGHAGSSSSAGRSNCSHTYVSGSYTWQEMHTRQVCTGSGKDQKCHTEVYYTTEHANIYSPYATREHSYSIDSSMGAGGSNSYKFQTIYLDADPIPYSAKKAIPDNIPRGAPADWADADKHLKANDPRPVTMMSSYDNYILASQDEVLKTYSSRIDQYKNAGLLPDPATNMMADPISGPSHSLAEKVAFLSVTVTSEDAWQQSVMRFNAAFGMKLQGDLHVVVVNSSRVQSSEAEYYVAALKAYWQSPAYAKRAIAKNAVILVIGSTGGTIDWARAQTGMPFGNEEMEQWVQDTLPGKSLDPALLFGTPKTVIKPGVEPSKFTTDDYTVTLSTPRGLVEEIMFEKAPFKRARMSCNDSNCVGYKDLVSKIEPTTGQETWMVVVSSLISLGLWVTVGMTSIVSDLLDPILARFWSPRRSRRNNKYTYDNYSRDTH